MRYFEYKAVKNLKDQAGNELKIDPKEFFLGILGMDTKLSTEQFLRIANLYDKVRKLKESEWLEIEDQDYQVVAMKFQEWVGTLKGAALAFPELVEFVQYMKDLPSEKKAA